MAPGCSTCGRTMIRNMGQALGRSTQSTTTRDITQEHTGDRHRRSKVVMCSRKPTDARNPFPAVGVLEMVLSVSWAILGDLKGISGCAGLRACVHCSRQYRRSSSATGVPAVGISVESALPERGCFHRAQSQPGDRWAALGIVTALHVSGDCPGASRTITAPVTFIPWFGNPARARRRYLRCDHLDVRCRDHDQKV